MRHALKRSLKYFRKYFSTLALVAASLLAHAQKADHHPPLVVGPVSLN